MPTESVASFDIEYTQVLAPDGTIDETIAPDVSDDQLYALYRGMKRARRFDERSISLQRRGELGTYAPSIGQEAAQVASALALRDDDWVVPAFREQGVALLRGTPMDRLLLYAMGMEEGAEIPANDHAMPPSIPVGSQALHATGIGWANALADNDEAVISYFGDGATSQGDVYEALNIAGVFESQVVFLCQNNQYAISTPRSGQTRAETLAQKAVAAGIAGVQVDGNDPLGVYLVTRAALDRAREGAPTLVEALTYRRSMHTTSDDPSRYRTAEEEAEWARKDPIDRLETYLRTRGVLDDGDIDTIEEEFERDFDVAFEKATAARDGLDPADMFRYAFDGMPPAIERQFESFQRDRGGDGRGD
ncbi:MAG: pyruvate dehydrogenase (acetyl-transferring) E1 component subunit alpha [Halobacteriales archaeon]|nr:pyruvate dehydrogenase (acetyl-transferring) E1 component subunit alpha [Halobacteriales archaeon]